MYLLRKIYTIYCFSIFTIIFLLLLPIFLIVLQNEKWHSVGRSLYRFWARAFFTLIFMPIKINYTSNLSKNKSYVFCSNHFSFMDIPAIGSSNFNITFVGKSSLGSVPLFGYMYNKLNITVDRSKLKSRYETMLECRNAIKNGQNLVFFPEGGIIANNPPKMARFKDGAFRLAIEEQVPVVPVTIPYNWKILGEENRFLIMWQPCKVIIHEPIPTIGMGLDEVELLKKEVFNIIQKELNHYNYESR